FSSRRRHTRSKRDWSSDVCSSDLDSIQSIVKSNSNLYTRQNRSTRSKRYGTETARAGRGQCIWAILYGYNHILIVCFFFFGQLKIGRASCRERVSMYLVLLD